MGKFETCKILCKVLLFQRRRKIQGKNRRGVHRKLGRRQSSRHHKVTIDGDSSLRTVTFWRSSLRGGKSPWTCFTLISEPVVSSWYLNNHISITIKNTRRVIQKVEASCRSKLNPLQSDTATSIGRNSRRTCQFRASAKILLLRIDRR